MQIWERRDQMMLEVIKSEFDGWTLLNHIQTCEQQMTNETTRYLNHCLGRIKLEERWHHAVWLLFPSEKAPQKKGCFNGIFISPVHLCSYLSSCFCVQKRRIQTKGVNLYFSKSFLKANLQKKHLRENVPATDPVKNLSLDPPAVPLTPIRRRGHSWWWWLKCQHGSHSRSNLITHFIRALSYRSGVLMTLEGP